MQRKFRKAPAETHIPEAHDQAFATRASLPLKPKAEDEKPRQLAWAEFPRQYVRPIAGFARKPGARPAEADDVTQKVLVRFHAAQPVFQQDPPRGRFRSPPKSVIAK